MGARSLVLTGLICSATDSGSAGPVAGNSTNNPGSPYAGSSECRECHSSFYQKWAPSHHGLAMQPFTPAFARAELTASSAPVTIGKYKYKYQADVLGATGRIWEQGPEGAKSYPMAHAMGGRNVYYFLTPAERGRLQVLPIAYDVRKKEWFDTTASAIRHFRDRPDEALNWREQPLTFNSSCHACHVSQISPNYDLETDTYHTTWHEPGISCETCHGPGEEHVRLCRAAKVGKPPGDLKIISTTRFSQEQINSLCAPCHAKMSPVANGGNPGDPFFDRYDLATYEDRDFHPDGRDLGENYTYTQWLTSPCVQSGKLDCLHCHTSSGRYRFNEAQANQACLPCHKDRVQNPQAHTHHAESGAGSRCVSCHMPKTEFARMTRTDHSMRPPTPATTLAFNSPNACNLCHTNRDAAWANTLVRQWHTNDYQVPVMRRAGWINDARSNQWTQLPEMLVYLSSPNHGQILATSLIRLLANCPSNTVDPVLIRALKDPSPLVRSSAATTMGTRLNSDFFTPLLAATTDDSRLVRVRAASALAAVPLENIPAESRPALDRANAEFESAMNMRPDDAASHYNLGNFFYAQNRMKESAAQFQTAMRLQPENLPALINGALAENQLGQNELAERHLRQAFTLSPTNGAVNLNLGLLLGELERPTEAIVFFRQALNADTNSVTAAYNLGILLTKEHPSVALEYFRHTIHLQPDNPKFLYTFAFHLHQNSQTTQAIELLQKALARHVSHPDIYALLGGMFESQRQPSDARNCYRQAAMDELLPPETREEFRQRTQPPPPSN
jgi:Tfp pilus assembly protein PilF